MTVLVVVDDQPYGGERPYTVAAVATALSRREDVDVRVLLVGDAVTCAIAGQKLPDGHSHLDRMSALLLVRFLGFCVRILSVTADGAVHRPVRERRPRRLANSRVRDTRPVPAAAQDRHCVAYRRLSPHSAPVSLTRRSWARSWTGQ